MCLVSFVPYKDSFSIISNRDESIHREVPSLVDEKINGKTLYFPKDVKGGTWIGYDNLKNVIVLLNGGKEKHQRKLPYRKSRGLIVLELLGSSNISAQWKDLHLDNIEPFTIVFFNQDQELQEWIWDGNKKFTTILDHQQAYCWKSSTLYLPEEQDETKNDLKTFLSTPKTASAVRDFHLARRYENKTTPPIHPQIKTVSNTIINISSTDISLDYKNLR